MSSAHCPGQRGTTNSKPYRPISRNSFCILVAAHHGWARPVISTSGSDDPPSVLEERARDVTLRFARLQKQWGPWGLAWLEALLRAADQQASRDNDAGESALDGRRLQFPWTSSTRVTFSLVSAYWKPLTSYCSATRKGGFDWRRRSGAATISACERPASAKAFGTGSRNFSQRRRL